MIQTITKRDGRAVKYDRTKISSAIWKAVQSCGGSDREEVEKVTDAVEEELRFR